MGADLAVRKCHVRINSGDQLKVLSNGWYKSISHRVMVEKDGSRLSVPLFYSPDAVILPAPKVLCPEKYTFGDYLKLYGATKFQGKEPRLESTRKLTSNGCSGVA
ncbi:hypothetical protein ACJRO7_016135 [Eucalyptus globulus]|uniref:Isopenicillin N synthase-like Fe(2+) 2OG dioxygenase domain-containing protein n=1 Tax=Eucalyptus globulus TaxID=34317 RepID=A0ABD3L661_EUCGL